MKIFNQKLILVPVLLVMLFFQCKNTTEFKLAEGVIETMQDGKVLLRFNPEVGTIQRTKMEMDMNFPDIMTMKMTMHIDTKVEGKEGEDNLYDLNVSRIIMDTNAQGIKMEYDSDDKEANSIFGDEFGKVIGKNVKMTVSELGDIKKLDWGEAESLSQQHMSIDGFSMQYPERAVGVGDSWTINKGLPNASEQEMKMTMTISKITVDKVYIDIIGGLLSDVQEFQSSDIKGSYMIDKKSGLTEYGEIYMNLEVEDGKNIESKVSFKAL